MKIIKFENALTSTLPVETKLTSQLLVIETIESSLKSIRQKLKRARPCKLRKNIPVLHLEELNLYIDSYKDKQKCLSMDLIAAKESYKILKKESSALEKHSIPEFLELIEKGLPSLNQHKRLKKANKTNKIEI